MMGGGGYEGENGIVVFKLMNEFYIVYFFVGRFILCLLVLVLLFCI